MKKSIFAAVVCALSLAAQAREVQTVDIGGFNALKPEHLDAAKIYFTYTTQPGTFAEWQAAAPAEVEHLALWKGYTEPKIPLRTKSGALEKKLTVFISRAKAVLNKPVTSIDYASFIRLPFIQSLNAELSHQAVPPNQILPNIAGRGPVRSFHWCNKDGAQTFTRAFRETDLTYMNPPPQARGPWCSDAQKSICVESCYTFNYGWQQGVMFANNTMVDPDDQKDLGVATQSEIRYFANEAEMGMGSPVAALTGVNTAVGGVLRQNIFYVNQALQFGTVTAFFQEFPGDPSRTVVTSYFVFTVGTDTWGKYKGLLREVLMGRAGDLNTATGITAGLPKFTEGTANAITSILEK